ncbi:Sec-independent protein translocase protein TatB [Marinobacter lutaoensis]|jgi:sec-independent protein translocase protein TatB|uniref:Sec-independent protein translocase protein TatB n=1 Tax=Marinobacter lutaoensis TaxID=135739 RepID=UPI001594E72A|nr:Sec-independent protein translocase protein TatB [Marinobacter lutaoensis]NVD36261.1 twin-arginine translocase subunit TatB [Marinobacter lutaoensis]
MFDIGFLELLICAVIALLVLGPERLPTAARAAGRWVGMARRMVNQFSSELERQLKAEELRQELRKAGDVGLEDVQKTVKDALAEARKYEHMILPEGQTRPPRPAPATRRTPSAASPADTPKATDTGPDEPARDTPQSNEPPSGSPEHRS